MNKSDSIKNLAGALTLFHVKVQKIPKDSRNPFFKSSYASLSAILEAIDQPLIESGLTFSQFPSGEHGLTTIIMHAESGEYIESDYIMKPTKDDPQGIGSSITYQRRYALAAVLGLNIDNDDDGNKASGLNGAQVETGKIELPWLNENTKEFTGAVEKLKKGQTTIDKIKNVMRVSKATEQKLISASNN